MMRGLGCADPEAAAAVTRRAFEGGLIIERSGSYDEVIKFLMPLTTTYDEMEEGLGILERAMEMEFGHGSTDAAHITAAVAQ
jgi:diaminobutyrate-2-oxoglutarate transaminase